jgi:hypothetical protein
MDLIPLSLEDYLVEANRRMRLHADYRDGMALIADPDTADVAGARGYTFAWPQDSDAQQAWFDTRAVVDDVELQMRERYCLRFEAEVA